MIFLAIELWYFNEEGKKRRVANVYNLSILSPDKLKFHNAVGLKYKCTCLAFRTLTVNSALYNSKGGGGGGEDTAHTKTYAVFSVKCEV